MRLFRDGLVNFLSDLWNSRHASEANGYQLRILSQEERTALILSGLGNKICTIKSSRALKDTLQFESEADRDYYEARLAKAVRKAAKWAVGYGRGIIVLHQRGDKLSEPLRAQVDPDRVFLSVFDGGMVAPHTVDIDIQSERYNRPQIYNVRGVNIHHSRVVDFTYVDPPELKAPQYFYGGVSIFDLIYDQLVADGVVQRACPQVVDKAATMFYKVKGFKEAMQTNKHSDMVTYFRTMERTRGIMSAGLMDAEDDAVAINQVISNLADADNITLRRIAMVTSIPITQLVGENARGMNSSGDNEQNIFQEALETEQEEYWKDPINALMRKLGKGSVWFKDNQGETPNDRIDYETKAIDNAAKLEVMGQDGKKYLEDKDVVQPTDYGTLLDLDDPGATSPSAELAQIIAEAIQGGDDGEA